MMKKHIVCGRLTGGLFKAQSANMGALLIRTGLAISMAVCGTVFASTPALHAQSTFGSVRGTAQDASGASVPGTQVTLHSTDTNTDRVVSTDSTGEFLFSNVNPGHFSITASHEGFSLATLNGISLDARQDLRVPIALQVAAAQATTVQITAASDQINTENGTIGDSKGTREIRQLPLNFRAATTSPLAALATSPNVEQDSQGNIALGGATANQVNFSVDGISTANIFNSAAGVNPYPSSEGIDELKVTAFNNNAEFSQVGDVTFTTKAGTDQYHGSLFEYLQNDALDARVYNFTQKAPKRFNTFGGSVGGPLSIPHIYNGHSRTFFFFDYEGNRRRVSQAEQYTVPSLQDRMGNLSDLPIPNNTLRNPFTKTPYANNTITNINPTALALLNQYYPLPNLAAPTGSINYQTLVPIPSNTDGFDARVDQVINSKQQIYARYNRKNITANVVNPLLPNDIDSEHDRSFLVSHNYVLSSKLVNEFRFGFTDAILNPNFGLQGAASLQGLGIQVGGNQGVNVSNHPTDQGFPTIVCSDGTNFTPIGRDHVGPTLSTTKQLADNLTYTRGKHTIRGGVDLRWVRFAVPEIETPSDDYGLFTFNQGVFTGSSFGDFLIGAPNTTYFAITGPRDDAGGLQTASMRRTNGNSTIGSPSTSACGGSCFPHLSTRMEFRRTSIPTTTDKALTARALSS